MKIVLEPQYPGAMSQVIATLRQEAECMVMLGRAYDHTLEAQGYLMYLHASTIELQWEGIDMVHDRALMENEKTYPISEV